MEYTDKITIAILCKQKAHCLPYFLECIFNQTYPKNLISLYVRSNNNTDNTLEILKSWIDCHRDKYANIYEDYTDVPEPIQNLSPHEWTTERFIILGNIRNKSLEWAYQQNSHYFVVDCDNFIIPCTVEEMFKTRLGIVGPLLHSNSMYSNYHKNVDARGYYAGTHEYGILLNQTIKSCVSVEVIHCTYFVRWDILPEVTYIDDTSRHEYVIFSHSARKKNILQFLDTRQIYGRISMADTLNDLKAEPWFNSFFAEHLTLGSALLNSLISTPRICVISPQAGFGNRLRAMGSCIIMAIKHGYTPYYVWNDLGHARLNNLQNFTSYFEEIIPRATVENVPFINHVFTEWLPHENWYWCQSGGQNMWPACHTKTKIVNPFLNKEQNILIETSLQLDVSNEDLMRAYTQYFRPLPKYMDLLNSIPHIDVGISIRRGDLLIYFEEARQEKKDIVSWIINKFSGKTCVIFSDDWEFRQQIILEIQDHVNFYTLDVLQYSNWEIPFIEFLILSYKVNNVYGTPKSSFAEQAGLFGGKNHYGKILD